MPHIALVKHSGTKPAITKKAYAKRGQTEKHSSENKHTTLRQKSVWAEVSYYSHYPPPPATRPLRFYYGVWIRQ